MRSLVLRLLALLVFAGTPAAAQQQPAPTEVVILGVDHSAQLVNRRQQPAALRALFAALRPDAICIERAPERVARRDHYEFTYEIQNVILPWAAEARTPLCPFDWMPSAEDSALAFGIDDLERPPLLRARSGFQGFVSFPEAASRNQGLFYADAAAERERNRAFYLPYPEVAARDVARRLFLYRTFMQARRIAQAARNHPGGRILVVVGSMHKDDIERILASDQRIRISQPSALAAEPDAAAIARHQRPDDLLAIATFNLLAVQSQGEIDLDWIEETVRQLQRLRPGPETDLLATRLAQRRGRLDPAAALAAYQRIAGAAGERPFTWDGVKDRSRIDSAFDPFANLTIAHRARVEEARIHLAAGRTAEAEAIRAALRQELATPLKQAQFDGYWPVWLAARP